MDKAADIIGGILAIAMVTTIVAHPRTKEVIGAAGNAFTGSLKTAMGTAATTG